MIKKFKDLICPQCGKNEPVFYCDFELRGWPLRDFDTHSDKRKYDMDIENDFGYMASAMDDAIEDGYARCECSVCGTEIPYLEEDGKDET